jgi:hypothetical protein
MDQTTVPGAARGGSCPRTAPPAATPSRRRDGDPGVLGAKNTGHGCGACGAGGAAPFAATHREPCRSHRRSFVSGGASLQLAPSARLHSMRAEPLLTDGGQRRRLDTVAPQGGGRRQQRPDSRDHEPAHVTVGVGNRLCLDSHAPSSFNALASRRGGPPLLGDDQLASREPESSHRNGRQQGGGSAQGRASVVHGCTSPARTGP